jgi:hypothetical protein
MEMREQNNALKQSMMLTSTSEIDGLKLLKENAELKVEVEIMTNVINKMDESK